MRRWLPECGKAGQSVVAGVGAVNELIIISGMILPERQIGADAIEVLLPLLMPKLVITWKFAGCHPNRKGYKPGCSSDSAE